MALDLTGARAAVEGVLFGAGADECRIIRRSVDPVTFDAGEYIAPAPVTIYTGPCSVRSNMTTLAGRGQQGAVDATQQRWSVAIPLASSAADPPRPGDVVVMTTSRDDALDGARFPVRDVAGGTNAVLRRLTVDRWVPGGGDDWAAPSP